MYKVVVGLEMSEQVFFFYCRVYPMNIHTIFMRICKQTKTKKTLVSLVRERTVPTE
jgi:hypothetical protein